MPRQIDRALDLVLADLAASGFPPPYVEESTWQTWQPSESAMLNGSGGVYLDLSLPEAEALAGLAD